MDAIVCRPSMGIVGTRFVEKCAMAGLAIVLVAYSAYVIIQFGMVSIDGIPYSLVDDDIMISMRYASNLAEGNGLVFNPGEHVEGFTNPILTLLMACAHLLPISKPMLPLLLMLINLGLNLSIMYMVVQFWRSNSDSVWTGLLGGLFYVTLPNHAWYAFAGYEVYMLMAVLLFSIRRMDSLGIGEASIVGLLPLTHGTALVPWAILVASIFLYSNTSLQRRLLLAIVATLPFFAYEIFRLSYYQDILPNTYWLKVGAGSIGGGITYVKGWLISVWPIAILALFSIVGERNNKTILLWVCLAAQIASAISLGGDIFHQYRFLFPSSVLLAVLAGQSTYRIIKHIKTLFLPLSTCLYLLLMSVLVYTLAFAPLANYRRNVSVFEMDKRWNIRAISLGTAIRDNTDKNAVVAMFGLGYAGYYSDRYVIDMLGKADRHIAHAKSNPNRHIGHNKTDFDYVVHRSPDYIALWIPPKKFGDIAYLEQRQKVDLFGYTFDLALHPTFRKEYAPIVSDAKGRFFPFYTRSDHGVQVWNVSESYYENLEPWMRE